MSPRTSAHHGETCPRLSPANSTRSSIDEPMERKDSHMPTIEQSQDKLSASVDAEPSNTSKKRPHRSSSFFRHPRTWLRTRRTSSSSSSSSSSTSSSSSSAPSSPTTRPTLPARRTQPRPATNSTLTQLSSDDPVHLPPGLQVPAIGHAGPSDWLHRGWAEHDRQLAQASTRPWHPLAAASYLPTGKDESQRVCGRRASCAVRGLEDKIPGTETRDFATNEVDGFRGDWSEGHGGRMQRPHDGSQGACVTTLTLKECEF